MIDLYTWHTPNGRKISIMIEQIGMYYNVNPINIILINILEIKFIYSTILTV